MSFPYYAQLVYGAERTAGTTKLFPIGTEGRTEDGRVFRYCLADGNLLNHRGAQSADVAHEQNTAAAASAGDLSLSIVLASAAKDAYEGGFIEIHTTVVQAALKIRGNDEDDDTNTTFYLWEPLLVDAAAGTFTSMHENAYNSVTAKSGGYTSVVCIPRVAITSGQYFWGQTKGPTICTAGFGSGLGSSTANERSVYFQTDGSIGAASDRDPSTGYQYAGYMIHDTTATDDIFFYLQLE